MQHIITMKYIIISSIARDAYKLLPIDPVFCYARLVKNTQENAFYK